MLARVRQRQQKRFRVGNPLTRTGALALSQDFTRLPTGLRRCFGFFSYCRMRILFENESLLHVPMAYDFRTSSDIANQF